MSLPASAATRLVRSSTRHSCSARSFICSARSFVSSVSKGLRPRPGSFLPRSGACPHRAAPFVTSAESRAPRTDSFLPRATAFRTAGLRNVNIRRDLRACRKRKRNTPNEPSRYGSMTWSWRSKRAEPIMTLRALRSLRLLSSCYSSSSPRSAGSSDSARP